MGKNRWAGCFHHLHGIVTGNAVFPAISQLEFKDVDGHRAQTRIESRFVNPGLSDTVP